MCWWEGISAWANDKAICPIYVLANLSNHTVFYHNKPIHLLAVAVAYNANVDGTIRADILVTA